jgi:hypothetical protein
MLLNKEDIKEINAICPYGQGIFSEPNGIPVDIKEPVIYSRYEIGGYRGGSCFGSEAKPYTVDEKPKFKVLDMVLKKIKPDLTYLEFRELEDLIKTNEERDRQYYGNSTDYKIEYIILSDLYKTLKLL